MDPLFGVANSFHVGAYQLAINAGADLTHLSDNLSTERDALVYRAYIALGSHQLVLSEINDSAPSALQAIKLLATYLSSEAQRPSVLTAFEALLSDAAVSCNPTVLLCAASCLSLSGAAPEALKLCHTVPNLELLALATQILLSMERPDVAERTVKQMCAMDDDSTLTQLAQAWTNLALGGAKVTDASYTFQELGDKFTWTPKLHCAVAACQMAQGHWEEAEKELMEGLTKDGKDTEVLSNLVVCNLHLGRRAGSKVRTYLAQLKAVQPQHPLLAKQAGWEGAFDAAAAALS